LLLLGSFLPLRVNKPAGSVLVASVLVLCIYTSEKDDKYYYGSFKFIAEKTVEYISESESTITSGFLTL